MRFYLHQFLGHASNPIFTIFLFTIYRVLTSLPRFPGFALFILVSMMPVFLFPNWLADLWWSAPPSMQYPLTVLTFIFALLGIRTINSWIRRLWKDPFELIAYAAILVSSVVVVAQLVYYVFNQVSTPIATFAQELYASTPQIPPPTAQTVPLLVALVILTLIILLGMWWFGLLTHSIKLHTFQPINTSHNVEQNTIK